MLTLLMMKPVDFPWEVILLAIAFQLAYYWMKRFRVLPFGLEVSTADKAAADKAAADKAAADKLAADKAAAEEEEKKDPVPYDRFKQVNDQKKAALEEKKKLEEKLAILDKAEKDRKDAELSETDRLKAQKAEAEQKLLAAEARANQWTEYEKKRREQIKTALGDKWDEEYSTIPLTALEKIASTLQVPLKDGHLPPKSGPAKPIDYTAMSSQEFEKVKAAVKRGETVPQKN